MLLHIIVKLLKVKDNKQSINTLPTGKQFH